MDIVIVGHLSRDLIITPETKREALGGGTAYAMLAPALDAYNTGIVSKVGEDFEEEYWNTLKSAGLNLAGLSKVGTTSTRFVNKYDSEGNRVQIVEAVAEQITPDDFPDDYLDAKIIHFSPLTANELDIDCIKLARSSAKITSIDVQGYVRSIDNSGMVIPRVWTERNEILSLVDVVKFHELELKQTIEGESELSAVSEILNLGPRIVLVTRDNRGSTIYTRNEQITIPLVNAGTQIDSTGCGDVYSIGFLLEYVQTSNLKQSGFFAATCSSFNCEMSGPYNFPSRLDIERRMKRYLKG
ncbi:MAG: carbohydrate kinase family protein [Candidatus Thorarchaeota archaeon]